jgi:hypothetical protein
MSLKQPIYKTKEILPADKHCLAFKKVQMTIGIGKENHNEFLFGFIIIVPP